MVPLLLAQAAPIDPLGLSTPITLALAVLALGFAAAWGASLTQIAHLKEKLGDLEERMSDREKHGGEVDKELSSVTAVLKEVHADVKQLLGLRRAAT